MSSTQIKKLCYKCSFYGSTKWVYKRAYDKKFKDFLREPTIDDFKNFTLMHACKQCNGRIFWS